MKLRSLKYLLMFIPPLVILFSILSMNYWSYFALFFIFGLIPLIEIFTNGSTENLSEIQEEIVRKDKLYDLWLYLLVPTQYVLFFIFLNKISIDNLSIQVKIGITSAFALSCGILGINAAHELGHRSTWYEQLFSKMLLLSTLYLHFFIEHNRGHHTHVATDEDPASSRYGENIYLFYYRSIIYGYKSAWKLEIKKLAINHQSFFSWSNEMLIFQIIQFLLILFIGLFFGLKTLFFYLIAAFLGILLLETVNYIEHYGLRRKQKGTRYERTQPIHSWNSNHPLGRLFLLELSRHSDHHYLSNRKYQILRHFDESPQMPTGYPGMMLLALVPPLWFKVMRRAIENYKKTQSGKDLA